MSRDYVMARLLAAHGTLGVAREALDTSVGLFLFPDQDSSGKERLECMEVLLDAAGELSRAVEQAQEAFTALSEQEVQEEEPPYEADSSDEGEEDEEDLPPE